MKPDIWEYYWDNDPRLNESLISVSSLEELKGVTINGVSVLELINKEKFWLKEFSESKMLGMSFRDKFGEVIIEKDNKQLRKIRIVPWKFTCSNKVTPEEVYQYINTTLFDDIRLFLSLLITHLGKTLKGVETFSYTVLHEFPRSLEFLIYLMENILYKLQDALFTLFARGPIHKEIEITKSYTGTQILLSSLLNPSPYKKYIKRCYTYQTVLNIMLFQSLYFIITISKLLKENIKKNNPMFEKRLNKLIDVSEKLLNKYHLWSFFSLEPLDDLDVLSALISQSNRSYKEVYKIYKVLRDVYVFFTLVMATYLEGGIYMPIVEFFTIYEIWTISKFLKVFLQNNFELLDAKADFFMNRSTKMYFILKNCEKSMKITFIWELKFKPLIDSTYYGSLLRSLGIQEKLIDIKPDITIIIEGKNIKKVLIGDVKFSLNDSRGLQLPKLESLYKVMSYVKDLKRSKLFEGFEVEGVLVYPGNIPPLRIPDMENENYINIIPLNMFMQPEDSIMELIEKSD